MNKPPAPGYLLAELGWIDENEAAAALDLAPPTLVGYRKAGVGPAYAELARKIMYSKQAIADWLAAGGTRQADEALKGAASAFPSDKPAPVAKAKPAKRRTVAGAR